MGHYTLDLKDRNILFELSLNGRASVTELAKKVKLSKQVVSYRLARLEQDKVILGYHAITNVYALGMAHYRVFLKYQNMSSEKEQEFMNFLIGHPKVIWIAYFDGDFDAAYLVWAKTVREFEQVFDEINNKYGQFFQQKYFSIATKIEYLRYKFINDKHDTSRLVFGDVCEQQSLDKLDRGILNELNRNSRTSLVYLANQYNSSPKVIRDRIKKLMARNILIGFNIQLNHNLLGYTHRKVLLKLNDSSSKSVAVLSSYLRSHKNVIFIIKPLGDYDFEFELMTYSNEEFHNIIKELRSKFADLIQSYITVIHYSEPKSGQSADF